MLLKRAIETLEFPDRRVLNPSCLAYATPIMAVKNINDIVLNAPICDPILINK